MCVYVYDMQIDLYIYIHTWCDVNSRPIKGRVWRKLETMPGQLCLRVAAKPIRPISKHATQGTHASCWILTDTFYILIAHLSTLRPSNMGLSRFVSTFWNLTVLLLGFHEFDRPFLTKKRTVKRARTAVAMHPAPHPGTIPIALVFWAGTFDTSLKINGSRRAVTYTLRIIYCTVHILYSVNGRRVFQSLSTFCSQLLKGFLPSLIFKSFWDWWFKETISDQEPASQFIC